VIESEVRATFKRLDIDRDSRVTFSELKRLFTSSIPSSANSSNGFGKNSTFYDSKSSLSNSKGLSDSYNSSRLSPVRSPLRSSIRSPLRSSLRSPVRSSVQRFYSPNRYSSPLRDRTLNVLEMSNERMNRSLGKSPEPPRDSSNLFNASSSSGFKSSSGGFNNQRLVSGSNYVTLEEENFVSYLKELLDIENQIEKAKCDMIIKSDFNTEDAFGIFEIDRRSYITDLDIKYGLNSLDIFPIHEEIALLIKRYDMRGEGILR
jgi:Ca2+-binding EF-hand superfamily protein